MQQADVKIAILRALQEERTPRGKRMFKVLLASSTFFALLSFGLGNLLFKTVSEEWVIASSVWTLLGSVAYWFYLQPQPRIEVRGFWTPFVFSRLFIATIVVTVMHLLVCPHFAFVETKYQHVFPIFERLTDFYMSIGGHDLCMFLCGMTFGGLAAVISSWGMLKTLSLRNPMGLLLAALAVPISFAPLLVLQWAHGQIHLMAVFWLVGAVVSALLVATSLALLLDLIRKRKS